MKNTSQISPLRMASGLRVLCRIALSIELVLMVMFLAPLCWGLLPIGYNVLKRNESIEANPMFLVFMRMGTSAGIIFLFSL